MATQTATVAENVEQPSKSISVRLRTRHKDLELPQDHSIIRVATFHRRYALSRLVNSLLESEKPIPFDFLIKGQILKTSLEDFLTANGISAEEQLTVEYLRAIMPPSLATCYEHDDWVSSVDILSATSQASKWAGGDGIHTGHERILSGSYDNLLRVWNMSNQIMATSPSSSSGGHTNDIKAAKFLSPTRLVSSSLDRTIRIWKYNEDPSDPSSQAHIIPTLELYGHRASIDSLAIHAPSQRIISASADHTIGVWSTSKSNAPPAPASLLPSASPSASKNKRRKANLTSSEASSSPPPQRGPLALLKGHTAHAAAVLFAPHHDAALAHSASRDHTVRTWDLPTQRCLATTPLPALLLSLCALPALSLLAAGSFARTISLVDTRASGAAAGASGSGNLVAMTLRGHAGPVAALAAAPDDALGGPWGLVSGGFDGTCRVWDVRSVRTAVPESGGALSGGGGSGSGAVGESLFVIDRESEKGTRKPAAERTKVFGVCWDRDVGIASAGEDHRVQINRIGN